MKPLGTYCSLLIILLLFSGASLAQQWKLLPGTDGYRMVDIAVYPKDPDTIYAYGSRTLRSVDRGETWDTSIIVQVTGDVGAIGVSSVDSRFLLVAHPGLRIGYSQDISMSTDGGATWRLVFYGAKFPTSIIEFDPSDPEVVYVGLGPAGVLRSSDRGVTWEDLGWPVGNFIAFAVAPSDSNVLYYAGMGGLTKSTDRGVTWNSLFLPVPIQGYHRLAVDPRSADIVYFTMGSNDTATGGVYKSYDGGDSWSAYNNGLAPENCNIWALKINPRNPDEVYLGCYSFYHDLVFRSTDAGANWSSMSTGLPDSAYVAAFSIDTVNNRVYAAVARKMKGGLYLLDLTSDVKNSGAQIVQSFCLYQNYPNPFNPSTSIRYEVPVNGEIKLAVYDMLGREVAVIDNGYKTAGTYIVNFNAVDFASGVYYYKLTAGTYSNVKKLVLVK
jgi:photosystem II stability/assembly factor-like uncharacterized protein